MVNQPETLLGLILLFPAVGALVNGLVGDRLSEKGVSIVGCLASLLSFAMAGMATYELTIGSGPLHLTLFDWIGFASSSGEFDLGINAALAFDTLAATMVLVITGVGSLIHLYSIGYMAGDPGYHRYFAYLNLFLFAMLILVLGDNLVLMFVGWEGVGLASYLLIGFWFKDLANADAGKKAFITNRVGDFAFLLGIFMAVAFCGTVNFAELSAMFSSDYPSIGIYALLMGLCFFAGACGKSAQIPLHVWLPDAMAGPTPVSALIHAATMVTAGVYMVARMGDLFAASEVALQVVCLIGATTALFAASIGLVQNDIKKVLAYSTVSQLGYMFMGMGVGPEGYPYGIFHLVTHAFFKALLFLGAGAVIHALHHEQDMRNMGGLRKRMPVTFWCFIVGGLALAGVPPFSGFFSKDAILHHVLDTALHGHGSQQLVYGLAFAFGLIGVVMTAFYITRLIAMTFLGSPRGKHAEHAHEVGGWMKFVLLVLLALSAAAGFVLQPVWKDWLSSSLPQGLGHAAASQGGLDSATIAMALSIAAAAAGIILGYLVYVARPGTAREWGEGTPARKRLHELLTNKYYVDEFYQRHIVDMIDRFSSFLFRKIDVAVIDGIYNDLARGCRQMGFLWSSLQNGHIGRYAGLFALGGLAILVYVMMYALRGGAI